MSSVGEPLYHVTALSNFARAFDKYTRHYRKSSIAESRYPQESYLVPAADLSVGVAKASRLCDKLSIPGDGPLVLQAAVGRSSVQPNRRNGVGLIWPSPDLPIAAVFKSRPMDGSAPNWRSSSAREVARAARRRFHALRRASTAVRVVPADCARMPGRVSVLLFGCIRVGGSNARCAGARRDRRLGRARPIPRSRARRNHRRRRADAVTLAAASRDHLCVQAAL